MTMNEQRINLYDFQQMLRQPLQESDVDVDHQWRFKQDGGTFTKDLGLKGKYCYHPFNTVTIDSKGHCYVCTCQAWLPISVGNILDFTSLNDIVYSIRAREIQASIIDGTYKYCDDRTCHILNNKELAGNIEHRNDGVNWIVFAIDESCNLSCPSCRKELVFYNKGPDFDKRMRISDHLVTLIQNHNNFLKFTLSGDGDPFASHVYRNLLEKLQIKPDGNTEIEIVTNGILVKSHWERMRGIHHSVVRFKISFDAGTAETYAITRRGGDWDQLIESCRYIVDWKKKHSSKMQISANFVVQTSNYQDILTYVKLCQELEFDEINFQKVVDWGKWQEGDVNNFDHHAVWQSSHPNHAKLIRLLNDPLLLDQRVQLNNLSHLRNISAKLSDLVSVKNTIIQAMNTDSLTLEINNYQRAVESVADIPGPHSAQARIIASDIQQLSRQTDPIAASAKQMLVDVQKEIDRITKNYHARGYMINGSYATNRTTVEGERQLRTMKIYPETKEKIVSAIGQYVDWRYAGLEIGPGDGVWTEYLVACDPLYLVDIHSEFLNYTVDKFNQQYQIKLRTYVTKETNLDMLPQNQFGFVFSWNVFNYLTSDLVDQYLSQIYQILRPGGVCMFSYNNADRPNAAVFVETGFMSYLPKHLLLTLTNKHNFELIKAEDCEETVSWIEIRKPGDLRSIKVHPVLGHVHQK